MDVGVYIPPSCSSLLLLFGIKFEFEFEFEFDLAFEVKEDDEVEGEENLGPVNL